MRAGGLTYRLEVIKPTPVVSAFSTEPTRWEWVTVGVIRAERVRIIGRKAVTGDELFFAAEAVWNIRDAHTIKEGWRVREVGGLLYEVTAVEPNHRKRYITLRTQKVNE